MVGAGVAGIVLFAGLSFAVASFNKRNHSSKCNLSKLTRVPLSEFGCIDDVYGY